MALGEAAAAGRYLGEEPTMDRFAADSYELLRFRRDDGVLTIALNRPERLNAINHELHEELGRVFIDAALDEETRVVVLTGAGPAFSAGGDIKAMRAHAQATGSYGGYVDMATAKRIVFSLLDLEKPIIARVNGDAMGLGATLALMCDLVYMADNASIADPHVSAGVVAGDGGAVIWPALIGFARAKEYLLTGDKVTAAQAEQLGLVNHAVPATELDATVYAMARRLADGPAEAIRGTKVSINIALKQLAHTILDASIAYESFTMRTPAHAEAMAAFVEKRAPVFVAKSVDIHP
jgi:enoyl-CoA hydratase